VATLAVGTVLTPSFLTTSTLSISLNEASVVGLIAVGLTVVLLAGQLDLSSGSVLAVSGILAVLLQDTMNPWLAALVGVLAGSVVGLINGLLVVVVGIDSLVTTLATMLAVRAVAHVITGSQPHSASDPTFGLDLNLPWVWVFTQRSVFFVAAVLLLHFWVTRTASGRHLLAIGSNRNSARASGVPVSRFLISVFVFAGTMSGVAGVVLSLSIATGSPAFGSTIIISVIAAVVVGGTRLEGGRGSALGTLGGVVTLGMLTTAMEYRSVPAYWQQVVLGVILIALVLLDRVMTDRSLAPRETRFRLPFRALPASRG
jgi:ribose/xylose/arabinose/galactoside ABC-type transport system permease subunit